MRILYLIPRYWPSIGGAQLLSRELVQRIGQTHAVGVVTQFTVDGEGFARSVASVHSGTYEDGEIRVQRIGPRGPWRPLLRVLSRGYGRLRPLNPVFAALLNAALVPQLGSIVRTFRPDVIHAVHIGLIYSSETASNVARRHGVPFVWTPLAHIEGDGWRGPRFRRLYRTADALIAMTNREKEWLVQQGAAPNRVHVVPVGPLVAEQADAEGFRRKYSLGDSPVVLFLGQKLPYKGYRQIVEAASNVWQEQPDTRFVFIGPRTAESDALFRHLDDPRVVELPAVDLLEKTSALAACDVFCMPSLQESLGGVYLEAWTFRKPVIAANIGIAREVVADGKDGLLVAAEPEAIGLALLRLLRSEAERLRMGAAGYNKVRRDYQWNQIAEKAERVYSILIHGG